MIASRSILLENLSSYVPYMVMRYVAANPSPLTAPVGERFPAAVLFADISGFTRLTERLTRRGPAGVEDLSNLLNAYFGQLIDIVLDHHGDIVEFTGDGIIVVWETLPDEELEAAVVRAAHCGLAVQRELTMYAVAEDLQLSLRVSVGAGEVLVATVGGVLGRWELLVAGDPLVQVSTAEHQAYPGNVVLSPEAWAYVEDRCSGHHLPEGGIRLEAVHSAPPYPAQSPLILTPQMVDVLRGFMPGIILNRLEVGLSDWLAELRYVTVLFVNVGGLDYSAPDALEQSHSVMRALQTGLYQYEGSVNQFIVDDKGTIFVAAMGLPPLTHEDDAVRGVQAALAMYAQVHNLGYPCSIGISTGWVFCGARGNLRRRDYAMIGDTVNLAARLMQAAADTVSSGGAPILCDAATCEATHNRLAFEPLAPLRVKGKAEPVHIFRPMGRELVTVRRLTALIGRTAERARLLEGLQTLKRREDAGIFIIEGDTGMGKSRLITSMVQQAQELGINILVGSGDSVESSTSYHVWRPIFAQLSGMEALPDDPLIRRRRVLDLIWVHQDMARLAPLINAVLPLDIPENEVTAHMRGQVRADNTRRLLVRLLQMEASLWPTVLVLDEAHWFDSASWALVLAVAQNVRPLMFVIATRTLTEPLPPEYSALLRHPRTQRMVLERLSPHEIIQLVCQRLGVEHIPEQVAALIIEKSQGNPFFSEELIYALRDTGAITIADGECTIAHSATDLSSFDVPASVQGVVVSRIDRLLPSEQLMLKVASVIGQVFAVRTLQAVHPIDADRPHLLNYLQKTERLNLTSLQNPEPGLIYIFNHIIIQEVVYNLLLFAQRRELHRTVAEWYEQTYLDDLSPFYPMLAHHWRKAEDISRAIAYLEKAGEQALHAYANREAVRFFRELLALTSEAADNQTPEQHTSDQLPAAEFSPPGAFTLRRARWERLLGDAYLNLGQLAESRQHLEHAVALLQRPIPTRRRAWTITTVKQALRQALHRLRAARHREYSPEEHAVMLESARAYESLLSIYYFANETLAAIYTSLFTLNLSERAGPSAELARAYANMCITTGSLGLHPLAEGYGRQARETAQQAGEQATRAYALNACGLYWVGVGKWQDARLALEQAVDICDQLGDWRSWGANWTLLAQIAYYEGDFVRSAEMFEQLASTAQHNGNTLQHAWAIGGQGQNALRLGNLEAACHLLEQANMALIENAELPSQISNCGLLAMARLRQGDMERAHQAARNAASLLADVPVPASYYLIEGYAGFAEVYLALWEASGGQMPDRRAALARQARQACEALAHYARTFAIGQPRMWLCQGRAHWLAGRPASAHQAWQKGLVAAERLAMPYEQVLLHYTIGRHSMGLQRREHLQQAEDIARRLNTAHDLARIAELQL